MKQDPAPIKSELPLNRVDELQVANEENLRLEKALQEKTKELGALYNEMVFQDREKGKREAELLTANEELAFQNDEKEKRAAELVIANVELAFQNGEKEKRSQELIIANKELAFQNGEKEKREAALILANDELAHQYRAKEKWEGELLAVNIELATQNGEKEKRAAELIIANKELAFQNGEKEKRANELIIANKELAFQNEEKEKRATELIATNKELEAFAYVSSHDLQEPLRKIQTFASRILARENDNLSDTGKNDFARMQKAATSMRILIDDLLAYSRTNVTERKYERIDLGIIVKDVKEELKDSIEEANASIESNKMCACEVIVFQFRQLMHNLLANAIKFASTNRPLHIIITSTTIKGSDVDNEKLLPELQYCHIKIADNGIGFEPRYKERIFEVFQKLHGKEEYDGTGIGLAIVKKIVENHHGFISATGEVDKGATFDIYIPFKV